MKKRIVQFVMLGGLATMVAVTTGCEKKQATVAGAAIGGPAQRSAGLARGADRPFAKWQRGPGRPAL